MKSRLMTITPGAILAIFVVSAPLLAAERKVSFEREAGSVKILVDGQPLATYVYQDPKVLRPYLTHVHAPNGAEVTRNYPPIEGVDATDHDTMHPGIWLAFGELSGADFWRNKGHVEHVEFVEEPATIPDGGQFIVRNRYLADDRHICDEVCKIAIWARPHASILVWDSKFSGGREIVLGDQEEMGLGLRVATPLTVKNGGMLVNSDGLKNEEQVWGKQADWCDYSGVIDGQPAGLMLVPDPINFRRSWFHARDYGVLVANPFGQRAFTRGEASRVVVPVGEILRLRFAIVAHSGEIDLGRAASNAVTQLNATR
jgi:hypothetical protein